MSCELGMPSAHQSIFTRFIFHRNQRSGFGRGNQLIQLIQLNQPNKPNELPRENIDYLGSP